MAAVYRLRVQKYERLEEVRSILQRRQKYNKSAIFFKDPNQFDLTQLKIENCVHYDNTPCAGESFFLVTNCGWGSTWTTRSSIPGLVPWTKSSRTTLARWAHHWHILNPKKDQRISITAYNKPSQSPVNFYLPFLSRLNEILCHWAWSEVKTLGLSRV